MPEIITYGRGGFDPRKTDDNIIERTTAADPDEPAPDPVAQLVDLLVDRGVITADDRAILVVPGET
jgi:hypothetical protein